MSQSWDTLLGPAVQVQAAHRAGLDVLFAGARPANAFAICGLWEPFFVQASDEDLDRCLSQVLGSLPDRLARAADEVTFYPLVVDFWPLGVHFVDSLFGARVYPYDGNFWSDPLPGGLADLRPVDFTSSPLVRWTLDAMLRLAEALPEPIALCGPVLASPLNIAVNILGQQALVELTRPGEPELRGLRIITDAIRGLHDLVRATLPEGRYRFYCSCNRFAPDGFGHICGCSTQLVGPETYAAHLAPLDAAVLAVYPEGGTIHLCGHHTQHLPCWREMRGLRGVQLNDAAADDFRAYFEGLRDDQVIYIAPTPRMTAGEILRLSGGRRVVLQMALDRPLSLRDEHD